MQSINYKEHKMKIHFIAIGGSAMHNLALALQQKGYEVSGSDDEIFEPSKSRLEKAGILPPAWGWFPEKITSDMDAIILGMHARPDNPELLKAQELGIRIYSYPEYLYEQTKDKKRIVIGGSHGKTTTTSLIMHILQKCGITFDYMVGASLDGFDTMVHLSKESKIAVFEGDEYLSSPIDPRPKFHHYHPDIAILTGIAWDHMNVFPTFGNYVEQFGLFLASILENGSLVYFDGDENIRSILPQTPPSVKRIPYHAFQHTVKDGVTFLQHSGETKLSIFGEHNMQNIAAAYEVCKQLNISDKDFLEATATYQGASKRLQPIASSPSAIAYLDFAHSPSKLKATLNAVKEQYPDKKIIACMELHTFSSLNAAFLPQYKNCMDAADIPVVFFNPEVVKHKKLPDITAEDVKKGFTNPFLSVFTDNQELLKFLRRQNYGNTVLLIMTSGNFSGIHLKEMAEELLNQ